MGETVGMGRAFALKHHYDLDSDQELLGLGVANIGTGSSRASRWTAACRPRHGRGLGREDSTDCVDICRFRAADTALLGPLFAFVPQAVLGRSSSTPLSAWSAYGPARALCPAPTGLPARHGRLDRILLSDVMVGLTLAVFLSLIIVLYSLPADDRSPRELRKSQGRSRHRRHPECLQIPGLLILRIDSRCTFQRQLRRPPDREQVTARQDTITPADRRGRIVRSRLDDDRRSAGADRQLNERGIGVMYAQVREECGSACGGWELEKISTPASFPPWLMPWRSSCSVRLPCRSRVAELEAGALFESALKQIPQPPCGLG